MTRKCRFEVFGCDFAFSDSDILVAHENVCDARTDIVKGDDNPEESEGEDIEEELNDDQNINNPMFLNLVYFYDSRPLLHFYAVAIVFLRSFLFQFGDIKKHSGLWVETLFICLGWAWLFAKTSKKFRRFLEVYQPDEFATQFAALRRHLRSLLFQDAK